MPLLHRVLAKLRHNVDRLPGPVRDRVGALGRRATTHQRESARANFASESAYFDHLCDEAQRAGAPSNHAESAPS